MAKINKNIQCVIGKEFCAGCDLFDGHECTRENTDCKKCLRCANFGVNPCGWGGVTYVCKQTEDNSIMQ